MSISPVNLFVVNSYTNQGNRYKKSNAAKTVLTAASIPVAVSGLKTALRVFPSGKNTGILRAVMLVLSAFGLGTIVDGLINKITSHKTDKIAQQQYGKTSQENNMYQG